LYCENYGFSESLNALQGWHHLPTTNRDRIMIAFMNIITDGPDWTRKVYDEVVVAKWKEEAMNMDWDKAANTKYGDMSEKMFDYASVLFCFLLQTKPYYLFITCRVNSCELHEDIVFLGRLCRRLVSFNMVPEKKKDIRWLITDSI
jgi:hypothetical protein